MTNPQFLKFLPLQLSIFGDNSRPKEQKHSLVPFSPIRQPYAQRNPTHSPCAMNHTQIYKCMKYIYLF